MRLRSQIRGILAAVALMSVVLTATASAQRAVHSPRAARSTAMLLRIARPGVYGVRVTITTTARRRSLVKLRVGHRVSDIGTPGGSGHAELSVRVNVASHVLAIHALDSHATLRLSVRVRRLRSIVSPAGEGNSHNGITAGATGNSGPTSAASGTAASAAVSSVSPPAPASPAGAPGPPGDPSTWHVALDDEFNGSSLDTSLWSTGWGGSGVTAPVNSEELECYDPSQVVEAAGELDLNLIAQREPCGGQTRPYTSGLISTAGKFSYTYGYLEVRAWLPGTGVASDWPAIWTDGQSWPTDGELDVVEGLGGQPCWHFHDSLGAPGGCEATGSYLGGWHTFGADWEPGSVTYYYDGTDVGTLTSGITSAPMYLILDLAADTAYGGPIAAPATLRIDYVRLWQH